MAATVKIHMLTTVAGNDVAYRRSRTYEVAPEEAAALVKAGHARYETEQAEKPADTREKATIKSNYTKR
jgi:hypothetical protein